MQGELLLIAIVLTPLLIGLIFRVRTSQVFFGLMAGELLGRYFGHEVDHVMKPYLKNWWFNGLGEIVLITIPVLLTAIMLRGSLSKNRLVLACIPLLVIGIITAAFVLPILPAGAQNAVRDVPVGDILLEINKSIVGVMIGLQLIWFWLFEGREKTQVSSKTE